MCMFCAAIPAVTAMGVAAHGQQREAARQAESEGRPVPKPKVPAAKITTALVVVLAVASIIYHTRQFV